MNLLKHTAIALALAASCTGAHAQIITACPTCDLTVVTQAMQQIAQLKAQLDQARQQYEAITGSVGGYSSMLPMSISSLRGNLPQNWSQVYSDAMNSTSSVSGSASSILSQFDNQIRGMGRGDALKFIDQQLHAKGAYDRAMTEQAYDNQMRELNDMQTLTQQIGQATTQKQIEDLQARIQTAQGAIHGEQAKLQLMAMGQQAQEQLLRQQQAIAQKRYLLGDDSETNTAPDLTGN
ncbi:type IV secretion system protein [Paraburkholderia azotifigens]|uniref:Type IV secretion system protein n=1 Tax=Paraburkholderia azotifigens TaxID=2057004 RepID=A0A5C6VIX6_9BURK|nr:type IV secretion system protein [Paraburkholderia azotifigens]TXC85486.1 type IV secretion system protein [Paraburkholderia azotifigens]TXC85552.1 type IV secretion system protein [Paraburkholderia azotifigens]